LLLLGACMGPSGSPASVAGPESGSESTSSTAQEIVIPRALGFTPAEENCTETFGECKVGQCELGPRDHFQRVTEVCCDANGLNCTTELYRLCGC